MSVQTQDVPSDFLDLVKAAPFLSVPDLARLFLSVERKYMQPDHSWMDEAEISWPLLSLMLELKARVVPRKEIRHSILQANKDRNAVVHEVVDVLLNSAMSAMHLDFPEAADSWLARKKANATALLDSGKESVYMHYLGMSSQDAFRFLESAFKSIAAIDAPSVAALKQVETIFGPLVDRSPHVAGQFRSILRGEAPQNLRTQVWVQRYQILSDHRKKQALATRSLIAIANVDGAHNLFENFRACLSDSPEAIRSIVKEFDLPE